MTRPALELANAYLALNLSERRQPSRTEYSDDQDDTEFQMARRIQRWRMLFPFLGEQALAALGAVHEIDDAVCAHVGNDPPAPTCEAEPAWLTDLESGARCTPTRSWTTDGGGELIGLLNVAGPWIEQARERLNTAATQEVSRHETRPCDADSFVELACRALPELLLPRIARTLVLELNLRRMSGSLAGDTPTIRFRDFCAQLTRTDETMRLLREYPVLARGIAEALDRWVDFSIEFLSRLCADWGTLAATFGSQAPPGMVSNIEWHKGDSHSGGRAVAQVSTSAGLRFVYKPRNLAVDTHFQELLAWLNDRGQQPRLLPLRILDRAHYGWVEFVKHTDCQSLDEVRRFYKRQGAYLALLYLLQATDIHFENAIASGEHPFIVDLETLFHPHLPSSRAATDPASDFLRASVLRVGMLPHRSFAAGFEAGVDLSALGGAAGQRSPFAIPTWQGIGTDEMRLRDDRPMTVERKNRPTIEGRPVDISNYTDSFLTGFERTYRALLEHRDELLDPGGPLVRFENDETRVVLRPTLVYASLRQASYHPDVLRDAIDRDALFGWLWVTAQDTPHLAKISNAEMRDLRNGDIPLFTTSPSSNDVRTGAGETFRSLLDESALACVRRRLAALDDIDLERQSWIIRAAFASVLADTAPRQRHRVDSASKCDRSQLLEESLRIGERIAAAALHSAEGKASWISVQPNARGRSSIGPVGMSLYDGLPGIALFLAHLASLTGERQFEHLARQALQTIRAQPPRAGSCGAFDGTAGVAYAFTHLGHMWGDRSLLIEANALVPEVMERALSERMFDVISGSAGCIMSLLSLHAVLPSDELLDNASLLGSRLVEHALPQEHGIAWTSLIPGRAPLTGFGHGTAGIGWALIELFQHTRNDAHLNAAIDAFAYERNLYSRAQHNWPDFRELDGRKDASFALGWCHGSPGVLLSRLRASRYSDVPDVWDEISEPLAHLGETFGWGHGLCHGDLGNLETLIEASEALGDSRWLDTYERQLSRTFQSGTQNGWLLDGPEGLESPGLMTGLAGVGLGLLRAVAPKSVPSILILAPPAR